MQSKPPSSNRPEKKIDLHAARGVGVAIWLDTVQTDRGPKKVRSITISPRRYKDPQSGEWKNAPSYRPSDLPALIFALQKALDYCYTTRIPGQKEDTNDEKGSA